MFGYFKLLNRRSGENFDTTITKFLKALRSVRYTDKIMFNYDATREVPCGLVARIRGFHPRGPGSIPGMGVFYIFFSYLANYFRLLAIHNSFVNFVRIPLDFLY